MWFSAFCTSAPSSRGLVQYSLGFSYCCLELSHTSPFVISVRMKFFQWELFQSLRSVTWMVTELWPTLRLHLLTFHCAVQNREYFSVAVKVTFVLPAWKRDDESQMNGISVDAKTEAKKCILPREPFLHSRWPYFTYVTLCSAETAKRPAVTRSKPFATPKNNGFRAWDAGLRFVLETAARSITCGTRCARSYIGLEPARAKGGCKAQSHEGVC